MKNSVRLYEADPPGPAEAGHYARMLRPGGFLLTNNRVFELPASPLSGVGFTDTTYISLPGIGDTGDRVIWYQRQ